MFLGSFFFFAVLARSGQRSLKGGNRNGKISLDCDGQGYAAAARRIRWTRRTLGKIKLRFAIVVVALRQDGRVLSFVGWSTVGKSGPSGTQHTYGHVLAGITVPQFNAGPRAARVRVETGTDTRAAGIEIFRKRSAAADIALSLESNRRPHRGRHWLLEFRLVDRNDYL